MCCVLLFKACDLHWGERYTCIDNSRVGFVFQQYTWACAPAFSHFIAKNHTDLCTGCEPSLFRVHQNWLCSTFSDFSCMDMQVNGTELTLCIPFNATTFSVLRSANYVERKNRPVIAHFGKLVETKIQNNLSVTFQMSLVLQRFWRIAYQSFKVCDKLMTSFEKGHTQQKAKEFWMGKTSCLKTN